MVLEGALFREYFKKVEVSNFEVASDAFQTFKDILTRHKALVATYLQSHYEEVGPSPVRLLLAAFPQGVTRVQGCPDLATVRVLNQHAHCVVLMTAVVCHHHEESGLCVT